MQHQSMRPVFVSEAKATDPVLGGGSLRVRPDNTGIVTGGTSSSTSSSSSTTTTGGSEGQSSLAHTTQRARAAGELEVVSYNYVL